MAKLLRKKTILVVDDDPTIRQLLRDILEPKHFHVVEVEDGQKALEAVHRMTIDLIITDRSMPGMGGLELLKALRQEGSTIPSLMVSAFGEEAMWAEAIGYGAQDYLLKPFKSEEVLKIVKKQLGAK